MNDLKKKSKHRVRAKCAKCDGSFKYLPWEDGNPQRVCCYRCQPRIKRDKRLALKGGTS